MNSRITPKSGPLRTDQPALVWSTCYNQPVYHSVTQVGTHLFRRDPGAGKAVEEQEVTGFHLGNDWTPAPTDATAPLRLSPSSIARATLEWMLEQSWWVPIAGFDAWAKDYAATGVTTEAAAEAAAWAARAAAGAAAWAARAARAAAGAAEAAAYRAIMLRAIAIQEAMP